MTRIRPGDTGEDEAKHIARLYRTALEHIARGHTDPLGLPYDPAGELHRIDTLLADHGILWHRRNPAQDELLHQQEWMNAADLAHALDRTPKHIYNWARLGHITQRAGPDGTPEYHVGSVITYVKRLRARRINHGAPRQ